MRRAEVYVHSIAAGILSELVPARSYQFAYNDDYLGPPISLTMPVRPQTYKFDEFPPFFDGVLPEGAQLEALLRLRKLDRHDSFGQLVAVGHDLVGAVTVKSLP